MAISSGRLIVYATAEMQAEVARTLKAFRVPISGPDQISDIVSKLDVQIGPLAIHGQPLAGAIDRLGKEARVNLVVEWAGTVGAHVPDAPARIDFHQAASPELGPMPLRAAIPRLFRIPERSTFRYAADDSVLLAMQEVPPQFRLARAYDVRDLVSHWVSYEQSHEDLANGHPPGKAADYSDRATDNLKYLVEHVVTAEAWYDIGGSAGDMIAGNGTLFVVADADQQRQVGRVLSRLRQIEHSSARPSPPEFLQPCEDVFAKLSMPIPELRLDNVTLDESLAVLGREAGVSIEVGPFLHDTYDQTDNRVTLRLWNVQLHVALQEVLRQAGGRAPLGDGIADGVLVVAARGSETPITRAYDVRDLVEKWIEQNPFVDSGIGVTNANFHSPADDLFPKNTTTPALEHIERILYNTVDEPSWKEDGGITGQISVFGGLLIITQSPENQLSIAALLNALRN